MMMDSKFLPFEYASESLKRNVDNAAVLRNKRGE